MRGPGGLLPPQPAAPKDWAAVQLRAATARPITSESCGCDSAMLCYSSPFGAIEPRPPAASRSSPSSLRASLFAARHPWSASSCGQIRRNPRHRCSNSFGLPLIFSGKSRHLCRFRPPWRASPTSALADQFSADCSPYTGSSSPSCRKRKPRRSNSERQNPPGQCASSSAGSRSRRLWNLAFCLFECHRKWPVASCSSRQPGAGTAALASQRGPATFSVTGAEPRDANQCVGPLL
mmetsp:Transcript_97943/g.277040  ORF Transcript_97943/g.277040 Transcript_97943/m.277040 type:complete len:235 (+) Transcript_97943:76-780(+)